MKLGTSRYLYFGILVMSIFSSCHRPTCKNSNPIFDEFDFPSSAYKVELQNQLSSRKQSDVRYWLTDFTDEGESAYLIVYIQADELCAKGLVKINEWYKQRISEKLKVKDILVPS